MAAARAASLHLGRPGPRPGAAGRLRGGGAGARERSPADPRRGRAARRRGHRAARRPLRRGRARGQGRGSCAAARARPWWCRSAGPSTTGPRSSWPPGPARPRARRSAPGRSRPERGPRAREPAARRRRPAGSAVRGVSAEPLVAEPGREGVVDATGRAGLLVIGLSERWEREGLGHALGDRPRRPGAGAVRAPRRDRARSPRART